MSAQSGNGLVCAKGRGGLLRIWRFVLKSPPLPFSHPNSLRSFGTSLPSPLLKGRGFFSFTSPPLFAVILRLDRRAQGTWAQRFQLGPPIFPRLKAGVRRRMTGLFFVSAYKFGSTARWPQRLRKKYDPPDRVRGQGWRGASFGTPETVCLYVSRPRRDAPRGSFAEGGSRLGPASPSAFRQSLNSQGISASDWRLAVRRDAHGLGRAMPYPGNRVQLRPSGDRIRSPSHDGEHRRVWFSLIPGLIFSGLSLLSGPSRRRALGGAPQGKGDRKG